MKSLVDQPKQTGYHPVTWDSKDEDGKDVSSGIYFYRLSVKDMSFAKGKAGDERVEIKKMVLIR